MSKSGYNISSSKFVDKNKPKSYLNPPLLVRQINDDKWNYGFQTMLSIENKYLDFQVFLFVICFLYILYMYCCNIILSQSINYHFNSIEMIVYYFVTPIVTYLLCDHFAYKQTFQQVPTHNISNKQLTIYPSYNMNYGLVIYRFSQNDKWEYWITKKGYNYYKVTVKNNCYTKPFSQEIIE